MRAVILALIIAVVVLIVAIQTGFLDITQTRKAEAPQVGASANGVGVTATGGQTPVFDVETGSVAVGSRPVNVTVQQPTIEVRPPAETNNTATTNTAN